MAVVSFRLMVFSAAVFIATKSSLGDFDPNPAAGQLERESKYHRALQTLLDVQVENQETVLEGLAALLREGHASVWETDQARIVLEQLKIRRQASSRYREHLSVYRTAQFRELSAGKPRLAVWDPWRHSNGLEEPSIPAVVLPLNEKIHRHFRGLLALELQEREAQTARIEARRVLLHERLNRIELLPKKMKAEREEIAVLMRQLAIASAELALVNAQPSGFRLVPEMPPLKIADREIQNWESLLLHLQQEWQQCLVEATMREAEAYDKLLETHQARLASLEADGFGRPGEFDLFAEKLRRLHRHRAEFVSTGKPPSITAWITSWDRQFANATATAESRVIDQQHVFQAVSQLTLEDSFFSAESRWQHRRARLATAEFQIAKQELRQYQAARKLLPGAKNVETIPVAKTLRPETEEVFTSLRTYLSAERSEYHLERAALQRELAQNRFTALKQLYAEGHASWWEVAAAKAEWQARQADLQVAQFKQQSAKSQLKLLESAMATLPISSKK